MFIVGRASNYDYIAIIKINQVRNCPVKPEGIQIAEKVFGLELGTWKGKKSRTKLIPVRQDIVSIPRGIVRAHRDILITPDIMYINTIPFFVTISRVIKFHTSQDIPNWTKHTYIMYIKLPIQMYRSTGFIVCMFLMGGEFEYLREALLILTLPIELSVMSELEHVLEIERSIQVIKKRARAQYITLTYRCMPRLMIKSLVSFQH